MYTRKLVYNHDSLSQDTLKKLRTEAKLTQESAAFLIGVKYQTYTRWELGINKMPVHCAELFLLKIGKHPNFEIVEKIV